MEARHIIDGEVWVAVEKYALVARPDTLEGLLSSQ